MVKCTALSLPSVVLTYSHNQDKNHWNGNLPRITSINNAYFMFYSYQKYFSQLFKVDENWYFLLLWEIHTRSTCCEYVYVMSLLWIEFNAWSFHSKKVFQCLWEHRHSGNIPNLNNTSVEGRSRHKRLQYDESLIVLAC